MSDYFRLYDAVVEAMRDLDSRNYNIDSAVVYAHPSVWNAAIKSSEAPFNGVEQRTSIVGCGVVQNENLPENVVMVVDVEMAPRSNGAVAFGTLSE